MVFPKSGTLEILRKCVKVCQWLFSSVKDWDPDIIFVFSLDIMWHELYGLYDLFIPKRYKELGRLDCNLEEKRCYDLKIPHRHIGWSWKGQLHQNPLKLEWHQVISTIRGGLVRMIPRVWVYIYIHTYTYFFKDRHEIGIWVNVRIFLFILDSTKHSKTQMLNGTGVIYLHFPTKTTTPNVGKYTIQHLVYIYKFMYIYIYTLFECLE